MGLFGLFSRDNGAKEPKKEEVSLLNYSGLRVEVLGGKQILFFVAGLIVLPGGIAELRQTTALSPEFETIFKNWPDTVRRTAAGQTGLVDPDKTPIPVNLRGFDAKAQKAVHLTCGILKLDDRIWKVDSLKFNRADNDRAFYRQMTNIGGTMIITRQVNQTAPPPRVEFPCEVRNVSAGGACIRTKVALRVGDQIILKFAMPGRAPMAFQCVIVRVTKGWGGIECGCQFLNLNKATEDQLVQAIMELQRRLRQG